MGTGLKNKREHEEADLGGVAGCFFCNSSSRRHIGTGLKKS